MVRILQIYQVRHLFLLLYRDTQHLYRLDAFVSGSRTDRSIELTCDDCQNQSTHSPLVRNVDSKPLIRPKPLIRIEFFDRSYPSNTETVVTRVRVGRVMILDEKGTAGLT